MINKKTFLHPIMQVTDLSRSDTKFLIETIIRTMQVALKKEGKLVLTGLGTLEVVERKAKTYRHPSTGEIQTMSPYRTVVLTPSMFILKKMSQPRVRRKFIIQR